MVYFNTTYEYYILFENLYDYRYTNLTICAVPCDNKDDLCLDNADENCESLSMDYVVSLLCLIMLATTLVGEVFHCIEEKANFFMFKTNSQETGHELIDISDWQNGNKKTVSKTLKFFMSPLNFSTIQYQF